MATWEFKTDGGHFKAYDDDATKKLEGAYDAAGGKGSYTMTIGSFAYNVDFDAMTQTNTITKKARDIKRVGGAAVVGAVKGKRARADAAAVDDKHADEEKAAKGKSKTARDEASDGSAAKSSAGKSGSGSGVTKKLIIKGRGAVDPECPVAASTHVIEKGAVVYQALLNQTNIGQNNNKFYRVEALASDDGTKFYCWTRWGRVGLRGQDKLEQVASESAAITAFSKKFSDKTNNSWATCGADYSKFKKIDGKYHLMKTDIAATVAEEGAAKPAPAAAAAAPSLLPTALQNVMKLISSKQAMEAGMRELEIDTKRMPLGVIAKSQIKDAADLLSKLETEIKKARPSHATLTKLSEAFYTIIPHDTGMRVPPVIDSEEMVTRKNDMLEMLSNLDIATKLLEGADKKAAAATTNPLDAAYNALKCKLTPLGHDSDEFQRVEKLYKTTQGATHKHVKHRLKEVFAVERAGEKERFAPFKKLRRELQWHGSRLTNWCGLLSQGLLIAPPSAPCTGYMFGKGVYLANSHSKSFNYCMVSRERPDAFMVLCEAALGEPYEKTSAEFVNKLPKGKNSTLGIGKYRSDPKNWETDDDGAVWPMGPLKDTASKSSLLYDEAIVYDVAHVKMRYLLHFEAVF